MKHPVCNEEGKFVECSLGHKVWIFEGEDKGFCPMCDLWVLDLKEKTLDDVLDPRD